MVSILKTFNKNSRFTLQIFNHFNQKILVLGWYICTKIDGENLYWVECVLLKLASVRSDSSGCLQAGAQVPGGLHTSVLLHISSWFSSGYLFFFFLSSPWLLILSLLCQALKEFLRVQELGLQFPGTDWYLLAKNVGMCDRIFVWNLFAWCAIWRWQSSMGGGFAIPFCHQRPAASLRKDEFSLGGSWIHT